MASQPRWSRLSSFCDPLKLDPLLPLRPLSDSAVLSGFVSQVSLSMSSQKMMPLLVLLTNLHGRGGSAYTTLLPTAP